jgi:site-specific DNA recombinase
MKKLFVGWARVSSKSQEREGWSLDVQKTELERLARQHGGEIARLFTVTETASKTRDRRTFSEFLAFVRKKRRTLAGVLIVRIDRATRNLVDWVELMKLQQETGVGIIFGDQPSNATPSGQLSQDIAAVMATHQVRQQTENIRAGQRRRAVEAGLPNGTPSYGTRFVRVAGRSGVEIEPAHGPKIPIIFRLYADEPLTLDTLITRLAAEGIIYKDSKRLFPRAVLHRILTNQTYIGRVHYQGAWGPGSFKPLVDMATWQRVQDRLGGKVYHAHELTYAGSFAACAHCGHVVTGEQKQKKSPSGKITPYVYYRCSRYQRDGHPRDRWKEAQFDEQLLDLFGRMKLDHSDAEWFRAVIYARAHAAQGLNEAKRQELHRQNANVATRLHNLLELRLAGDISQEVHRAKQQSLQQQQDEILAQLESLDRRSDEIADAAIAAFELSQGLKEKWLTAKYAAKKTILGIIVREARLNSEGLQFSLRKPFDLLAEGEIQKTNGAMGI